MLADNTLTLLAGINNKLDVIVESMSPKNKNPETSPSMTRLNRGSMDVSNIKQQQGLASSITLDTTTGSVKSLNESLAQLPAAIKGISKLHGFTIDRFTKVIKKLNDGLKNIKPVEGLDKAADSLKAISGLTSLPATLKSFGEVKDKDLNGFEKLMTKLSKTLNSVVVSPFDKTIDSLKALSNLTSLPDTIKAFRNVKSSDIDGFEKLMTKLSKTLKDIEKSGAILSDKTIDSLKSLSNLTSLPATLKSFGEVKDKDLNGFEKLMTKLSKTLKDIEKKGSMPSEKSLTSMSKMVEIVSSATTLIKQLSKIALIAPFAMIGVKLLNPIMTSFGNLISKIANIPGIEKGIKTLERMGVFANQVIKFAAAGVAMTLACLGIGILMKNHTKDIFLGLAGISTVLGAVTIVATLAAVAGKHTKANVKWFKIITGFALAGAALTLITAGIGILSQDMIKPTMTGFAFITSTLLGYTLVSFLAAKAGQYVRVNVKWFKIITGFAFAGVALTILTAGVGLLSKTILPHTMAGVGLIMTTLLAYTLVSFLAAKAGQYVRVNVKWFKIITGFALAGVVLTVLTAGIGTLSKAILPSVITGLALISVTLLGYSLVARMAALSGKGVSKSIVWFKIITGFALAGMILTLLTAGVGAIVKKNWDLVLFGMGAMSTTMLLIAKLAKVVNKASIPSKKALINIGILEGLFAATGALVLEAVGVGIIVNKHIKETLIGLGSMTSIILIIEKMSKVISTVKVTPASLKKTAILGGFLSATGALVLEAVGVGIIVNKHIKETLIGLGSMISIILLLDKISKTVSSVNISVNSFKSIGMMSAIFAATGALVLEAVGVGIIVNKHIKETLIGIGGMIGVVLIISKLGQVVDKVKISMNSFKSIGMMSAIFAATGALVLEAVGVGIIVNKHIKETLIGVASMMGVVMAISKLSTMISKVKITMTSFKNMAMLSAIVAGSGLLVLEAVGIGIIVRKNIKETIAGILGMISIIGTIGLLAKIASKVKVSASAIKNLALLTAVSAASGLVLGEIVGVTAIKKKAGVKWGDIFIAIGAMTTIILAMGALSFAAVSIPGLPLGAAALLLVDAVAAGSALVLAGVVKLTKYAYDSLGEKPWGKIFTTIGAMATLITGIGAICTAAGFVAPYLVLGEIAIAGVVGITALILKVVNKIVDLEQRFKEVGTTPASLSGTLKNVMSIFKRENLELPLKATDILKLDAQYVAILPIIAGLGGIAVSISKMVSAIGGMDDNGNVRPIIGRNEDGTPIFSEKSINLEKATGVLVGSVSTFVTKMRETFNGFDAKEGLNMGFGMGLITALMNPVSKFAEMLTSFEDAGENMLIPIKFNESGERIQQPPVNVVNVATTIAKSISAFAKELFSPSNAKEWESTVNGGSEPKRKKSSKVSQLASLGMLGMLISPISAFSEMLTKFGDAGDGEIGVVETDSDGKTVVRKLNLINIASKIAQAVTSFTKELFVNHKKDWKDIIGTEKGISTFAEVIQPVTDFANMLTMFNTSSGKLFIIKEGEKAEPVDVIDAATKISSAVSIFVSKMAETFKNPDISAVIETKDTLTLFFDVIKNTIKDITSFKLSDIESKKKVVTDINDFIKTAIENLKINDTDVSTITKSSLNSFVFIDSVKNIINNFSKLRRKKIASFGEDFKKFTILFNEGVTNLQTSLLIVSDDVFNMKYIEDIVNSVKNSFDGLSYIATTSFKLSNSASNFKTFTNAISAANKVLKKFSIPKHKIDSVTALGDAMVESVTKVGLVITEPNIKAVKDFSIKVNSAHSNIGKFDKILERGAAKRNKELKQFADSIEEVGEKFNDMSENLKAFGNLIEALNRSDSNKIKDIISEINEVRVGSSSTGGGSGKGLSSKEVESAIRNALNGVNLQSNGTSAIPVIKTNNIETEAIMSVIKNLANIIGNKTYTLETK